MIRAIPRLLRWFFGHLYTDLAWAYDAVAWLVSLGRWRTWQAVALDSLPPGPTLEIGHGPGHLQVALTSAGARPVGIDLSPQMSRLAARRLRRERLPQRLVRARVERLPFQGGSFTGAVSTFPSEYIIDPEALHEVARVLQAAGAFVIIPAASIVGGSIGDRLVTRLLRLTGDASDFAQSITRILRTSPFTFAVERVEAEHSLVVRIVCRTPPALVTAGTSD